MVKRRLSPISEPFQSQAFITKFRTEAFGCAVLLELAGIDQHRLKLLINDPFQQSQTNEFRAIVAAQIAGCIANADQFLIVPQ